MQNLYFREVIRRDNAFLKFISGFAQIFEKPPRLLLCVFLRENFGERHFNIVSASTLAFFLFFPFLLYLFGLHEQVPALGWIKNFNVFWLLFVCAFLVMSFRHHKAQKFSLTKYDFDKFSLTEGDSILPWHKILGALNMSQSLTSIVREVIMEPLLVFIVGIVLAIIPFSRAVGVILIISSIIYALSYLAAYWRARNSILDSNDERIVNEDMAKVFMGDIDIPDLPENTRIKFPPILPQRKDQKEGIYNQMVVATMGVQ